MGQDSSETGEMSASAYLFPKAPAVTATHATMQSIARCCASSARFEAAGALAAMGPIRRAFAMRLVAK